jgi:hypothetical protein
MANGNSGDGDNPTPNKLAQARQEKIVTEERLQSLKDEKAIKKEIYEAEIEASEARVALHKEAGTLTKKILDDHKETVKSMNEALAAGERAKQNAKDLVEQITGISDKWRSGVLGSILDSTEGMEQFAEGLKESLSFSNILGSTMQKVAQSTGLAVKMFDSAQAALAGLTGAGRKYNDQIMDVAWANRDVGVGITAAGEAFANLAGNMTAFTTLGKETQNELAGIVGGLERFGISGAESAATMDDLVKGFGMTASAAGEVQQDLAKMAIGLGIPPSQMSQSFKEAMPKLSAWGKESIKVFGKMATASKKLGVEMGVMLDLAGQFDTFEGAASAVGQLNALLGGDLLNAYTMLNASEEERIELMLQAIDVSGKSWNEMDRFERKVIANAVGIQNMNDANNMFMGGLDAYRQAQVDISNLSMSTEELAERQKAALDVGKKWQYVMESFAIAVAPIVQGLHDLSDWFLKLDQGTKDFWMKIIMVTGGLFILGKVIGGVLTLLAAFGAVSLPVVGAGLGLLTAKLGVLAALGKPIFIGLALVAAGLALIGLSVGIIGFAFAYMFDSIAGAEKSIGTVADGLSKIVGAAGSVTIMGVYRMEKVVDQAQRYVDIQARYKKPDDDALLQVLKETSALRGAPATGGNSPIILNIDGQEIGRILLPYINKARKKDKAGQQVTIK